MSRTEPSGLGAVAPVVRTDVVDSDWSAPPSPPASRRGLVFLRGLTMDLTATVALVGTLMVLASLIH